jgi:hypothetical protein
MGNSSCRRRRALGRARPLERNILVTLCARIGILIPDSVGEMIAERM